ncbi:CvpA family protein [Lichenihabitans sp. PAMC28606]|uniref:CvpA family protein n=1 Tax=Lichenihabitans sp. PAMC28606 TaxID=2880932 RepID=UPI001D0A38E5|nr:CvpA family protein [Lichenihabitans sp. PAMC28606]UDL95438.1 CvpA family protein [Lichenihabitans sp. PAMC28606]
MPSYLDLALLAIVLISALLSMVRGFTREVLAIASWAAAAVSAYYFYPLLLPFVKPYIQKDTIAEVVAVAIVFFATLIVVSIITVKLSDAILDSKVGALDRTLGFVFGAARGFLLGVVAFLFFNWLVPAKSQPEWVANAKSRPLLQMTGDDMMAMLPNDAENSILKRLKRDKTNPSEEVPADENDGKAVSPNPSVPGKKTDAAPTTGPASLSAGDKQRLDTILGKPAAAPGAKKP